MDALTPEQCRAARALLDMQQRELAAKSMVSKKTIADFERGLRNPYARTLEDLRRTFEAEGLVFLAPDEGVHGGAVGFKWGFVSRKAIGRKTAGDAEDTKGLDALDLEGIEEDDEDGEPFERTDENRAALHEVSSL